MKKTSPPALTAALGFGCALLLACYVATGAPNSGTTPPAPPAVPEKIKAPAGETLAFALTAKGVQIYECRAKKDDPSQCEWGLKAPEADLFDRDGKKVGKHYAGPTWESTADSSKVIAELKENVPSTDSNAIAWLLLKTKSNEGKGIFGNVRSIQRLETVGGKAPATGCDPASKGKEVRVPYSATYYFYVDKS